MLIVEEVKELPRALSLTDWSRREFSQPDGEVIVRKSKKVWTLLEGGEILLIVGLYEPAFIGTIPEMWLLMCNGFSKALRRNVLFVREHFEQVLDDYPHIEVRIEAGYGPGNRFARLMGFKEIRRRPYNDGKEYIIYEVRRGS